jgi:5-formyltetrahydrofolate cyclo-ligase
MSLAARKADLRSLLRRRRAAHADPALLRTWNDAIEKRVEGLDAWKSAGAVITYAAMPGEPATRNLMRSVLARGGRVACLLHVAADDVYRGVWIGDADGDLHAGQFGIPEPKGRPGVAPEDVDLALLPGLGFDRYGRRIGRGRGYIDELCAWLGPRPVRLAPAFSWQIVDAVPAGPDDASMDLIVTEEETIRVAPARRSGGPEAAIGGLNI